MDTSPWGILSLAATAVFVCCYLALLVRQLRAPARSAVFGGDPRVATAFVMGLVTLAVAPQLPVPASVGDALNVGACLLMLAALFLARRAASSDPPS